jgi:hypothetical protein
MKRTEEIDSSQELTKAALLPKLRELVHRRHDYRGQVSVQVVVHDINREAAPAGPAALSLTIVLDRAKPRIVSESYRPLAATRTLEYPLVIFRHAPCSQFLIDRRCD